MNIVLKINNINLEYELIYDSFFFILKCFVFRFLVFYRTEKRYSQGDAISLNCLLIETYRNLNYIGFSESKKGNLVILYAIYIKNYFKKAF